MHPCSKEFHNYGRKLGLDIGKNTCNNNLTIFSLTTTNYLDCLQKCKPDDQDLSSIDAYKCALKPHANATQKI